MAITPNFQASQSSGSPSIINLTDTSTGTDTSITKRRVYLLQANGSFLVTAGTTTDYCSWEITDVNTRAPLNINLDVLAQDSALSISVQWLNNANVVVTSKTISFAFTAYNETFLYGLAQDLVGNVSLSASTNWFGWMNELRVQVDSAQQAISFASDIVTAQAALNRATFISTNSSYFF